MKSLTYLHFQPTLSKLHNFQDTSIQLFFIFLKTLRKCFALTQPFFQDLPHVQTTLHQSIYILLAIIGGKLVRVYQIMHRFDT